MFWQGGDGELDPLCADAAKAVTRAFWMKIYLNKNMIKTAVRELSYNLNF